MKDGDINWNQALKGIAFADENNEHDDNSKSSYSIENTTGKDSQLDTGFDYINEHRANADENKSIDNPEYKHGNMNTNHSSLKLSQLHKSKQSRQNMLQMKNVKHKEMSRMKTERGSKHHFQQQSISNDYSNHNVGLEHKKDLSSNLGKAHKQSQVFSKEASNRREIPSRRIHGFNDHVQHRQTQHHQSQYHSSKHHKSHSQVIQSRNAASASHLLKQHMILLNDTKIEGDINNALKDTNKTLHAMINKHKTAKTSNSRDTKEDSTHNKISVNSNKNAGFEKHAEDKASKNIISDSLGKPAWHSDNKMAGTEDTISLRLNDSNSNISNNVLRNLENHYEKIKKGNLETNADEAIFSSKSNHDTHNNQRTKEHKKDDLDVVKESFTNAYNQRSTTISFTSKETSFETSNPVEDETKPHKIFSANNNDKEKNEKKKTVNKQKHTRRNHSSVQKNTPDNNILADADKLKETVSKMALRDDTKTFTNKLHENDRKSNGKSEKHDIDEIVISSESFDKHAIRMAEKDNISKDDLRKRQSLHSISKSELDNNSIDESKHTFNKDSSGRLYMYTNRTIYIYISL